MRHANHTAATTAAICTMNEINVPMAALYMGALSFANFILAAQRGRIGTLHGRQLTEASANMIAVCTASSGSVRRVMRIKWFLPCAAIAFTSLGCATGALAQTGRSKTGRILPNAPAGLLAAPQETPPEATSLLQTASALRALVMSDCDVAAWQVSIETAAGEDTRMRMSPTLTPEVKACLIKDFNLHK